MNNQVLSIQQMKYLKEIGVNTYNASACWVRMPSFTSLSSCETTWIPYFYDNYIKTVESKLNVIPAFTLQDILNLLPSSIVLINESFGRFYLVVEQMSKYGNDGEWSIRYATRDFSEVLVGTINSSLLEAAYELLCKCVKGEYDNEQYM